MARHHYLPQFLINKWFNDNKQLYYYVNHGGEIKEFHPKSSRKIFQKANLYKEYERRHFHEIDTSGSVCIKHIEEEFINGDKVRCIDALLDPIFRKNLSRFIISLTGRHPGVLERNQLSLTQISNQYISNNNPFKEEFENTGLLEAISLRPNNAMPNLEKLNWYLINFSQSKYKLITTDIPIALITDHLSKNNFTTIDEALINGAAIYFPINPELGFIASNMCPRINNINADAKFFNCQLLKKQPKEICSSTPLRAFLNNQLALRLV